MSPSLAPSLTMRLVIDRSQHHDARLESTMQSSGMDRLINPIKGGYLRTADIDADVLPGSADWSQHDTETNTLHIDVRVHFRDNRTSQLFFVRYSGMHRDYVVPTIFKAMVNSTTRPKNNDHFIQPIIEVSNAEHKWMEHTTFVGQGWRYVLGDGMCEEAVEYIIYSLKTG